MASSTVKGDRAETELMNIFLKEGFTVIRVPLSGRSQPMPDLIIARKGILYGFEVKMSAKPKAKFFEKMYDNLLEWLSTLKREGIPARAFLAVKVKIVSG